jgi:tetratricopeptide (TPR) repeat protein
VGERAAFHGRPADGVEALLRASAIARESGDEATVAAATWLLGVCLGASGQYGKAMATLGPVAAEAAKSPSGNVFGSLSASALASVTRQLGRHAEALEIDDYALHIAGDAPEAVFDARCGRVADLVGVGDAVAALAELGELERLLPGRPDWWRQRVRSEWVRAEVALLHDDHAGALAASQRAVQAAELSDAPRHLAKGLLFEGIALIQSDELTRAAEVLRRSVLLAERLGALPLLWAASGVLGALVADSDPAESQIALSKARETVAVIAADLPQAYAAAWLERPDIRALIQSGDDTAD